MELIYLKQTDAKRLFLPSSDSDLQCDCALREGEWTGWWGEDGGDGMGWQYEEGVVGVKLCGYLSLASLLIHVRSVLM
jgi:hypothetical protein